MDGCGKLCDVADPVLEQVADTVRAILEQPARGLLLDFGRKNDNTDVGDSARISRRRQDPSVVWVGGIRTSRITTSGRASARPGEQRVGVFGLKHHFEPLALQHACDAFAKQHGVVG